MTESEAEYARKLRAQRLVRDDSPIIVVAHPDEDDPSFMHLYVHDPTGSPLFVCAEPGGYGLHLCDAVRWWLDDSSVKIVLRKWPDVPKGYP